MYGQVRPGRVSPGRSRQILRNDQQKSIEMTYDLFILSTPHLADQIAAARLRGLLDAHRRLDGADALCGAVGERAAMSGPPK